MVAFEKAVEQCKDSQLKIVLKRLLPLSKYFCLLNGDISSYVKIFENTGEMPFQLKEWLKIFDGGLLFSVSMFSTQKTKEGVFASLLSFDEINSQHFKTENDIPNNVQCFGMTNYGNYYCFVSDEKSDCIYEWDSEKHALVSRWENFAKWLEEQITIAEQDIKDGLLPVMEE